MQFIGASQQFHGIKTESLSVLLLEQVLKILLQYYLSYEVDRQILWLC